MDRRLFLRSATAVGVAVAFTHQNAFSSHFAALAQVSSDIPAVTGMRTPITLEKAVVQELADSLRGNVLVPGNVGYDQARRVLNPSIDKRPALVVQPDGATDIQVSFAHGQGSSVQVLLQP